MTNGHEPDAPSFVMLSGAKHQPADRREFYVDIMSNAARTLYTGMTNDLIRRVHEHQARQSPGFTSTHGLTELVYVESTRYVLTAIEREKQIKGWGRKKKIALIESVNPDWCDLSKDWPEMTDSSLRSE